MPHVRNQLTSPWGGSKGTCLLLSLPFAAAGAHIKPCLNFFFSLASNQFLFQSTYLFTLFLMVLGLRYCTRAFSRQREGATPRCGDGLPIMVASLCCGAQAVECSGFSNCGSWALESGSVVIAHHLSRPLTCGILVLQPGIKLVSPALTGRFLTTGPPGKSPCL